MIAQYCNIIFWICVTHDRLQVASERCDADREIEKGGQLLVRATAVGMKDIKEWFVTITIMVYICTYI